ncbi:MAG: hypothetical protein APR63_00905 [Desulfuromonas sp. SDB]|nr:MAG: hypothetical protein APR63_00905 [Desulfuromonas sp. SDB]
MEQIKEILEKVDLSDIPAEYADLRVEKNDNSSIRWENGHSVEDISIKSKGFFLRVLKNGNWYYDSFTDLNKLPDKIKNAISSLDKLSRGNFENICFEKDGFFELIKFSNFRNVNVDGTAKRNFISQTDKLLSEETYLARRNVHYRDRYSLRGFISSRGRKFIYDFSSFGMRVDYYLQKNQEIFRGNYNRGANNFNQLQQEYRNFPEQLEKSKYFISAPHIQPGVYPVIFSELAVGVFAHESFGHKSEADFMIGDKAMAEEWKMGKKVGSDILSIIDDGSIEDSSGYTPFDDEGTAADKTYLVKNGVLSGRLHSVETAALLKEKPTGNGRAVDFQFQPIVRMTNTYIDSGDETFDNLLDQAPGGIYIDQIKGGTGLSTFSIAPLTAYTIKSGKLSEPINVSVVTGNVFKTLSRVRALSSKVKLYFSAEFGGCGKMEQMPLRVGFGGPKMLVAEMEVA